MVQTVDAYFCLSHDFRQARFSGDLHRMSDPVPGFICAGVMYRCLHLTLDVLIQRAAHRHVQYLNAPADAKDGKAIVERPAGQLHLHPVPVLVKTSQFRMLRLSVQVGVDIHSTDQEQAMKVLINRPQHIVGYGRGYEYGHASGLAHAPYAGHILADKGDAMHSIRFVVILTGNPYPGKIRLG